MVMVKKEVRPSPKKHLPPKMANPLFGIALDNGRFANSHFSVALLQSDVLFCVLLIKLKYCQLHQKWLLLGIFGKDVFCKIYSCSFNLLIIDFCRRFRISYLTEILFLETTMCDIPADIYLWEVNIRNTRVRCEICSKLTIKHQNDVIYVALVFLLITLNIFHTFF